MGHSHPAQSAAAAEEGGGPGGVSGPHTPPKQICAGLVIDSLPSSLYSTTVTATTALTGWLWPVSSATSQTRADSNHAHAKVWPSERTWPGLCLQIGACLRALHLYHTRLDKSAAAMLIYQGWAVVLSSIRGVRETCTHNLRRRRQRPRKAEVRTVRAPCGPTRQRRKP